MFAKLNLQPQERRLVVAVGLMVFVVLNFLFVWPHFKDWKKLKKQEDTLEVNMSRFQRLVDQATTLKKELNKLESQNVTIATEAQALELQKNVYSQAALSGVSVNSYTPMRASSGARTNQLFEEQSGTIAVVSGEAELLDFLYGLSSGGSLIRVLSMTLQPDKDHLRLAGTITLVASYQRTSTAKPATAPTPVKTNVPSVKATSPLTGAGKTNKPPVKAPVKSSSAPAKPPAPPPKKM